MPRCFTVRNAVIAFNIALLTALFLHLKYELFDRAAPVLGEHLSHLPDEYLDSPHAPVGTSDDRPIQVNAGAKARKTAVVVASQVSENATWLAEYFPQWEQNIYRVDDPKAPLTVPKNKGRESMVYLTYVLSPLPLPAESS